MASIFSHAVAALGIGACFYTPRIPKRVWAIGALCSVVPDLDVVGFQFGIRYGDFWGHRGFTHSIIFATLLAAAAVAIAFRRGLPSISRFSLWMYFFLATADAEGRPDCSFKGGMPGFVSVTGPSELAFPANA